MALYGLGNQKSYTNDFVSAMYYLYDAFKQCNATLIGAWDTDSYQFNASKAVVDGQFVGLALDQENQKDLTTQRIETWLAQLLKQINV